MDDLERPGWAKVGAYSYRHYCGAKIAKHGRSWGAKNAAGASVADHEAALQAALFVEENDQSFWTYGKRAYSGCYEGAWITTGRLGKDGKSEVFVCFLRGDEDFPKFLNSVFKRCFFDNATCVRCSLPMSGLQFESMREFHGNKITRSLYMVCVCGHPVWRLESDLMIDAERAIVRAVHSSRRQLKIRTAGGKHTPKEIAEILEIQKNRCIYCDVEFTDRIRPTKDHFLPVSYGGANWATNIVMACKPCNSRRCAIPFRSFCRLLSSKQNQRILLHLSRRLIAMDICDVPDEVSMSFHIGLAIRDPKDSGYRHMQGISAVARRNAAKNQLLPPAGDFVLKKAFAGARRTLRLVGEVHAILSKRA